jgi:hypothetical protein
MPQPLSRVKSVRSITWGAYALSQRPDLAAIVLSCIAQWAQAEIKLGSLLGALMRSDKAIAVSMYLRLTNAEARRSVLDAAAATSLNDDDYTLFATAMKAIKPIRDRRNDFAHGLWGITNEIPDALLWVSADDHLAYDVTFVGPNERPNRKFLEAAKNAHSNHLDSVMVYRDADLSREKDLSWQAAMVTSYLVRALDPTDLERAAMRRELLALPLLRKLMANPDSPKTPPEAPPARRRQTRPSKA